MKDNDKDLRCNIFAKISQVAQTVGLSLSVCGNHGEMVELGMVDWDVVWISRDHLICSISEQHPVGLLLL